MKIQQKILSIAVITFSLFALPINAQNEQAYAPIADAKVEAKSISDDGDHNIITSAVSDNDGNFQLNFDDLEGSSISKSPAAEATPIAPAFH